MLLIYRHKISIKPVILIYRHKIRIRPVIIFRKNIKYFNRITVDCIYKILWQCRHLFQYFIKINSGFVICKKYSNPILWCILLHSIIVFIIINDDHTTSGFVYDHRPQIIWYIADIVYIAVISCDRNRIRKWCLHCRIIKKCMLLFCGSKRLPVIYFAKWIITIWDFFKSCICTSVGSSCNLLTAIKCSI